MNFNFISKEIKILFFSYSCWWAY